MEGDNREIKIIGVDLRVLASGRQSGIEQYLLGLLPEMIRLAPVGVKFKLFFSSFGEAKLDFPWLEDEKVELHRFHYSNRLLFASSRLFHRPLLNKLLGGTDVFFSPHFLNAPVSAACRKVITFHDLSWLRYPQFFSWRKRLWHRWEMSPRRQTRRADKIIAVSCSTRNDLISLLGVPPEKIKVIYSGISCGWRPVEDRTEINRVRTRYQLPENFFLFLGTLEPRKNVLGLLRAFDVLHCQKLIPADSHLVLIGEEGWNNQEFFSFWRESPFRKLMHWAGVVDEKDKSVVYQLARVFVYPSFFEGFGFPPLEAMRSGLPVITSRTSSLPEVTGGAALMVDPNHIPDLAEAMRILFTDQEWREKYRRLGLERVKKFSWEKCARETLGALCE